MTLRFSVNPRNVNFLNLGCILNCFQAVPDFSINLLKSKQVGLENGKNTTRFAMVLGSKVVELPIIYLGMSLATN